MCKKDGQIVWTGVAAYHIEYQSEGTPFEVYSSNIYIQSNGERENGVSMRFCDTSQQGLRKVEGGG